MVRICDRCLVDKCDQCGCLSLTFGLTDWHVYELDGQGEDANFYLRDLETSERAHVLRQSFFYLKMES